MGKRKKDGDLRFWLSFIKELQKMTGDLTPEWPKELPHESQSETELFWMAASREEMRTRQTLSAKIRTRLETGELPSMTPIESWLLRRRAEWAAQLGMEAVAKNVPPPESMAEALEFSLVKSWESDGCIGLWKHAERSGQMHPEASDWLRGLQ